MSLQAVVFELPDFTPIPGYDPEGLFEWTLNANKRYQENRTKMLNKAAKKFPWLKDCIAPNNPGIVNGLTAEFPDGPDSNYFRPYGWHLDKKSYGSRLRMFTTNQPPIIAAGKFMIESKYPVSTRSFVERVKVYGPNWLEQITGTAPVENTYRYGKITDIIKDIESLSIVPAEPGVLIDGPTDTLLHTPSLIPAGGPDSRVIYRAQYNPAS